MTAAECQVLRAVLAQETALYESLTTQHTLTGIVHAHGWGTQEPTHETP